MYGGLHNIVFTDYTGSNADLKFLSQDEWLKNSVVITNVFTINGEWHIAINFVWVENRFRILSRCIPEKFNNETKATVFANMYKRTAQKDKRGELIIYQNDFNINYN